MFCVPKLVHNNFTRRISYILFGQNGETALMDASASGQLEVVKLLLAHPDVDVNIQNKVNSHF